MRSLTRSDLRVCQQEAVPFIKKTPKCAIWADMGLGKSGATITALVDLFDDFDVSYVLVVAPLAVAVKTWPDELRTWAHARSLKFEVLREEAAHAREPYEPAERRLRYWRGKIESLGEQIAAAEDPKTARALTKELKRAKRALSWGGRVAGRPLDISVINWQNLAYLIHFWGKYWPYDALVYDEASIGLKNNRKALVWRALRRVMPLTRRMVQLTGTPTPKGLINLWGPVYLLDGGQRLGRTLTAYRERYFTSDYNGWNFKPKPGAMEAVLDLVSDIVMVQRGKDYLDLPETIYTRIPVQLDDAEMSIYNEMSVKFATEIDGAEIEAVSAGVLTGKLMQLANGRVYDAEKTPRVFHDRKVDALEEYLESREGENVLCFYWFQHDLAAIQKRFPNAARLRAGAEHLIDDWNAGKIPLLLAHPGSAGHGLNLQHGGRRILWYGPTFDLELYLQANARLSGARAIGLGPTYIDHLIATGTIDEYVMEDTNQKDVGQRMVFDYLQSLRRNPS
jgi:SNF2 family DNA or RNA helicase